jgi:hypothetical protein
MPDSQIDLIEAVAQRMSLGDFSVRTYPVMPVQAEIQVCRLVISGIFVSRERLIPGSLGDLAAKSNQVQSSAIECNRLNRSDLMKLLE